MTDSVIKQDGEIYISIDTMLGVLELMIAIRDEVVMEDNANAVLVPGSNAAINFLGNVLSRARSQFIETHDLDDEVDDLLGDINDLLDEQ